MKKLYNTNYHNHIRKLGREKKLYCSSKGFYFMWNGRRHYTDNILRLYDPMTYTDDNGKLGVIGGYITISNNYGVVVELTEWETIQLWEEVK